MSLVLTGACGGGGVGSGSPPDLPGTGSAKLSWTAPTTRVDGSALDDLAGFRVYYGQSRLDTTSTRIEIRNPSAVTWTVTQLAPGTWFFAVTAFDQRGEESDRSITVSKKIS